MTVTPHFAARTHPGLRRANNQDSLYAGLRLFAVADGIGGSAAGEVASGVVISAMSVVDRETAPDAVLDVLRAGVDSAAQRMRQAIAADEALDGMGTTLTALLFSGDAVGIAHIGDSRAYLLRSGELAQLTRDDSYVQMLVDEGRISAAEASSHPYRSVVTKAMQGHAPAADYSVRPVRAGDRYLICSDGLSGVVSGETITAVMSEQPDPEACADQLMDLALRAGGPDNISIVIVDVLAGPVPPQPVVCSVPGFVAPDTGWEVTERRGADVPTAGWPTVDVPTAALPTAGVPAAEWPTAGGATADVPTARVPAAGGPVVEVPTARVAAAGWPAGGAPTAEVPAGGAPTADVPAGVPTAEEPTATRQRAGWPAAGWTVARRSAAAADQPAGAAPATPGAAPGDADHPVSRHRRSASLLLVVIGIVLLLAALAAGGWYVWNLIPPR